MKRYLVAVVCGLFVLGLAVGGAGAARALQATPTAVGVVDLPKVMEQLKEQQSVRAELMGRQEALQAELRDKQKAVQTLQGDLDLLKAGTPAYQEKEGQLQKSVIDLQVWSQFESQRLRLEEQVQVENLLRKISDTIGRVAGESGYDVVLFKGQNVGMRGENPQQQNQLNLRYVAWNSDAVDLTGQVVQRMNNEFSAGQ